MDGVRMARKLPSLGRFSRMVLEIEILSKKGLGSKGILQN